MNLNIRMEFDVEADDDDTEEQVLDIAEQEGLKFAAQLSDRLEQEGVKDIQVRVI